MKVNTGRVVLGGLLAGLVLNIGEFIFNDFVIGSQMKTWLAEHNFAEPTGKFVATAVGLTFVMGIVIVFTYALIRSRLGPGVNTAIVAGMISWFAVGVYVTIIHGVLFGFTVKMIGVTIVWILVEYVLAAIVGAWVYKEG